MRWLHGVALASAELCATYSALTGPCLPGIGMCTRPSEFFVAQQEDVPVDELWASKYKLRVAMLPAFIPRTLAARILTIGKSLDFLRRVCQDRESFNEAEMAARRLDTPQSDGSCEY